MLVALGKDDGKWGEGDIMTRGGEDDVGKGMRGRGRGGHNIKCKCDVSCHQKEAMSFAG